MALRSPGPSVFLMVVVASSFLPWGCSPSLFGVELALPSWRLHHLSSGVGVGSSFSGCGGWPFLLVVGPSFMGPCVWPVLLMLGL